jgi:tetratricopeptide (TPR) repeat protein
MQTLYPRQSNVGDERQRLENAITRQKQLLLQQLADYDDAASDNDIAAARTLKLKILALTPNDIAIKESLREIVWDDALEDVSEKTENIVKYFEENQVKAQRSIELTNLLERGKAFIKDKKFQGLLQLSDKLEALSPKHEKVNEFRYLAYTSLGEQQLQQNAPLLAIERYKQALPFAQPNDKQLLNKRLMEMRKSEAEAYYEQGLKMFNQDLAAAITNFQTALELNPSHPKVKQQLLQAQRIQENLMKIQRLNQ